MSFTVAAIVGAGVGLAKLGIGLSGRKKRIAEQKAAKAEMEAKKKQYEALDTSNTFKNMENKMEDLTINQRGMELQNQQGQQQRANIMQQMSGAAGGSGIAALAQQMAASGQLAAQKSAAMIGDQEAANQAKAAAEAARLQTAERQGEQVAQQRTMDKQATLLGMSQQRKAAADQARADARAAQMSAIGDIGSAAIGGITGGKGLVPTT
tara:strand:- start:2625 stop:3251 length:627 start_codon:yes stop_codon:yes gene_type:complete